MEELSRVQVKLAKIIVKYSPIVISGFYFISAIFSCFGIGVGWMVPIYYMSLIPFVCVIACSKLLKFCVWHRLPLYYSIVVDLINAIDFYFMIPIGSKWMLLIYLIVTGIFVLSGAYLKNKYNKRKPQNKI